MKVDTEKLHAVLVENLPLEEGDLLTGWVIAYEYINPEDDVWCGHAQGPTGMTTWRSLGLIEWIRRFTLKPDNDA